MNSIRVKRLLLFVVCSFATKIILSQNVAINASGTSANLSAILDLDGVTSFTGPNGYKGLLIPRMTLAQRTGIVTLPAAAQGLIVYQTDWVQGFYYNTSTTTTPSWQYMAPSASDWTTTGNTGTTASAAAIGAAVNNNFIGTTDGKDFVFATNNLERMRISTAGNVGVGTIAPTATALVTINPTVNALRNGIDMTMSGATATATGLNITTANSFVNGILVTQSSGALASSMYNIGAVLSTTNIVSGYNAYRNGSGLSYGIYAINGTNAAYATNASTWAAFLQGRTVISSENSPTSAVGTDLEVRNTTTGGAAPATVSLRQTTSVTVASTAMANLNFGDNYLTTPQAQIQVIRGSTSSSAADLPTDMIFSTTSNSSAILTERMRIDNVGYMGIGTTTPNTSLDVNGAYSARLTVAAAAAANVIPNNVSLYRLTVVAGVQANALSVAGPQNGQFLTIINEDGDAATFAGFTIPAASGVSGIGSFVYSSTAAAWSAISLYPPTVGGTAWSIIGNSGTDGGATNFIGTTDVKALSFRVGGVGTGFKSGLIDPAASGSTFFGYQAGKNILAGDGISSTGFGYQALTALSAATSGTHNTAFGNKALTANTSGTGNTAIGSLTLFSNVLGIQNTAVGVNALNATVGNGTTTGQNNTALGYQTLYFNSTGSTNTAVGYLSLNTNTTGSDNTALGSAADVSASGLTNATAIGANASVGASNSLVLGNGAKVGIGISVPLYKLHSTTATSTDYAVYGENTSAGATSVGVYGKSNAGTGVGVGGSFEGGFRGISAIGKQSTATTQSMGVFADVTGTGTGIKYGVFSQSKGTNGTNYALYGDAANGTSNFGLWIAAGETKITDAGAAVPTRTQDGSMATSTNGAARIYFRTGATNYYINNSGAGDYSEYFRCKGNDLKTGEIVSIDPTDYNAVSRANTKSGGSARMIGVVSKYGTRNNDSNEGQRNSEKEYVNVGLLGQLPVLISTENGNISPGDALTLSETNPGVAVKAIKTGNIIGFAMTHYPYVKGEVTYSDHSGSIGAEGVLTEPHVMIFVQPKYWSPQ